MNNERFAVPELLFHPSDVGIQEMGIAEAVVHVLSKLDEGLSVNLCTVSPSVCLFVLVHLCACQDIYTFHLFVSFPDSCPARVHPALSLDEMDTVSNKSVCSRRVLV